jgi:beta-catenin-like protein 1
MASIDDIFKKPAVPAKRKLDISHDPSQYYKSSKISENGDVKTSGSSTRSATVEDEPDQEDSDVEAGPAPPPDSDEENDDEDGRFFGSGVASGTRAALNIVDEYDAETKFEDEKYDVAWLRKLATSFEKKISKNAGLRAKFEGEPQKFMRSEADLDDAIKQLSILAQHPELYVEFAKIGEQGGVSGLVSLLAHENADIAVDAIHIVSELLDEDVESTEAQWNALVNAAIDADLLALLVQNLERLDETQEMDRQGVYDALSVVESLASQPNLLSKSSSLKPLIKYLLARVQKVEKDTQQNRFYAAEIISILGQSIPEIRVAFVEKDALEIVLTLLAPYRRSDPDDAEEVEFVENLFDALTSLSDDDPAGKDAFIAAEGVELMLIMIREGGKISKSKAVGVLDHAVSMSSSQNPEKHEDSAITRVCNHIVEIQGLKTIFGTFMKLTDPDRKARKQSKNKSKSKASEEAAGEASMVEHILGIFAALLRRLPDSDARLRLLAKFVEKEYEKLQRLVVLRNRLVPRLGAVEARIAKEKQGMDAEEQEDMEGEWLSRRLDAGLFSLRSVDTVLAWLCAEDKGAREKTVEMLQEENEGLDGVQRSLQGQLDGIIGDDLETQGLKDMLQTLIEMLV